VNQPHPNMAKTLRIAITGAGGYLGKCLCRHFKERGASVFQLTGNARNVDPSLPSSQFSLSNGAAQNFFADNRIDSLIHTAYDFNPRLCEAIWKSNVQGSVNLFKQARAEGVERVVFISSMSAFAGCRSLYGQAKLEIENALGEIIQGFSVRPGLIYSTPLSESGGMVGSLLNSISRGGLIPLVGNGEQELYLTHENDLARFIELLLQESNAGQDKPLIAANPRPYTLRMIIKLLAETVSAKRVKLIPVPWRLARTSLRMLESAGVNMRFRSDSVLSLAYQDKQPHFSAISKLFTFRDFGAAIRDEN
jgi:nucleoside-diphosphate-sugar epimerase